MLHWIKQLDRILRGQATSLASLRGGVIDIQAGGLSVMIIILGMLYGVCMGLFSILNGGDPRQLLATMLKVPALFFLTLLVTFPSLYVFNALVGSRLSILSVLRLLLAAMGVMLAVLASFGTIIAFFSLSTTSYPFMLLLNVVIFAVSGLLGLMFLLQTLHRLSLVQEEFELPALPPQPAPSPPAMEEPADAAELEPAPAPPPLPEHHPSALDRTEGRVRGHVKTIFRVWIVIFGLVGAQMGWVLRPFVGDPGLAFEWFRTRESNFFQAVIYALQRLFG